MESKLLSIIAFICIAMGSGIATSVSASGIRQSVDTPIASFERKGNARIEHLEKLKKKIDAQAEKRAEQIRARSSSFSNPEATISKIYSERDARKKALDEHYKKE